MWPWLNFTYRYLLKNFLGNSARMLFPCVRLTFNQWNLSGRLCPLWSRLISFSHWKRKQKKKNSFHLRTKESYQQIPSDMNCNACSSMSFQTHSSVIASFHKYMNQISKKKNLTLTHNTFIELSHSLSPMFSLSPLCVWVCVCVRERAWYLNSFGYQSCCYNWKT